MEKRQVMRRKTRVLLMQLTFQMTALNEFTAKTVESTAQNAESAENTDAHLPESAENARGYCTAVADRFLAEHAEDGLPAAERRYFETALTAIYENFEAIDAAIQNASDHWKLSRVSRVDLAILRLALAEIFYLPDIPEKVSVNEAVTLAKEFSGEDSYRYINGVLGKIMRAKEVKNDKILTQVGGSAREPDDKSDADEPAVLKKAGISDDYEDTSYEDATKGADD